MQFAAARSDADVCVPSWRTERLDAFYISLLCAGCWMLSSPHFERELEEHAALRFEVRHGQCVCISSNLQSAVLWVKATAERAVQEAENAQLEALQGQRLYQRLFVLLSFSRPALRVLHWSFKLMRKQGRRWKPQPRRRLWMCRFGVLNRPPSRAVHRESGVSLRPSCCPACSLLSASSMSCRRRTLKLCPGQIQSHEGTILRGAAGSEFGRGSGRGTTDGTGQFHHNTLLHGQTQYS